MPAKQLGFWRFALYVIALFFCSFWLSHPFFSRQLSVCLLLPFGIMCFILQPQLRLLWVLLPATILFDVIIAPYMGTSTMLVIASYVIIQAQYRFFVASQVMHTWLFLALGCLIYASIYWLYGLLHQQPLLEALLNSGLSFALMLLLVPIMQYFLFHYVVRPVLPSA